jgi:molecular chaperone DnaK (HSP70)
MMALTNFAFSQELKYDLGIVVGNQIAPIIKANEKLPINRKVSFSTSEDNQPAVFVHVGQNKDTSISTITRFDIYGIPHKPAGKANIEITFSIETNKVLKITVDVEGKPEPEIIGSFKVE